MHRVYKDETVVTRVEQVDINQASFEKVDTSNVDVIETQTFTWTGKTFTELFDFEVCNFYL